MYETGKFNYAEVDFVRLIKPNTADPYFANQWALENTGSALQYSGTPGADMKVKQAWCYTTGSSTIKVAVIDEGVNLTHPDLVNNLLPGYDATGNGNNGALSGNDYHGTTCAGVIAASGNNNAGIVGVAYFSKSIPVRIARKDANGNWITSDSQLAAGINWAVSSTGGNADILNCSWDSPSSSTVNTAISNAATSGRGGKGCVLIFSSVNDNLSSINYPASIPNVIAVGASTMCDQRKSPTSCNGNASQKISEIKVIDSQGLVRKIQKYNQVNKTTLDISQLRNGLYFIQISDGQKRETQRLIIQK